MPTPIETVEAFLAGWGEDPSGIRKSITAFFTPETVWENVGLAITTGIDEAVKLCGQFEVGAPLFRVVVEVVTMAADGDMVFGERVDHFMNMDGTKRMGVRCMGAYQVRDGKIILWRDYFDPAAMAGIGQGADAPQR